MKVRYGLSFVISKFDRHFSVGHVLHYIIRFIYCLTIWLNRTEPPSEDKLTTTFRDLLHYSDLDNYSCYLTLKVRGPSYLGLTRSISWLLMPWLLTSPGHQQPWYWLNRICRSFSYLRKCFKYLCQINGEEWHKMQIYVNVPSEKFSM